MTDDKIAAYTTLYTVLVTLSKVLAPFTPFMAESIYRNLVANFYPEDPVSVHLCAFPAADEARIDKALEDSMEETLEVVALGRAARNAGALKNRQPLLKLLVCSERKLDFTPETVEILKDELNVKEVSFGASAADYIAYEIKPHLKTLGPRYGKKLN